MQTNNTQHTPGPWDIAHYPGMKSSEIQSGSYKIAKVYNTHVETDDLREEQNANARLIASAPVLKAENEELKALNAELLEALKYAKESIEFIEKLQKNGNTVDPQDVLKRINLTIQKATAK